MQWKHKLGNQNFTHKTPIFSGINPWKNPGGKTNPKILLLRSNRGSRNRDNGPIREYTTTDKLGQVCFFVRPLNNMLFEVYATVSTETHVRVRKTHTTTFVRSYAFSSFFQLKPTYDCLCSLFSLTCMTSK
jgi:hypothetical protein